MRDREIEPVVPNHEPVPERWILLLLRLTQAMIIAWAGSEIPIPFLERELPLKNSLVTLACVILVGKAVYDTLFYSHYRP